MTTTALQKAFAPFKKHLPKGVWSPLRSIVTAVVTPIRFTVTSGHWKSSLRNTALDAAGNPIPWYTYPAIDFLARRDFSDRNILEFGGGQSSHWWSRRARSVLTIEEDADWFVALRGNIGSNVRLHLVPADREGRNIADVKDILAANGAAAFDVIVIDGHLREELTGLAFDYLAPGGAIVIDNSEGYGVYDTLKKINCGRVDFYGFAPGVVLRHCTSLVFRDECFLFKPESPIADLEIAR